MTGKIGKYVERVNEYVCGLGRAALLTAAGLGLLGEGCTSTPMERVDRMGLSLKDMRNGYVADAKISRELETTPFFVNMGLSPMEICEIGDKAILEACKRTDTNGDMVITAREYRNSN
ncbi:MAG TPA: hypothetical protein VJA47_03250 [archaeon]|nr:hypothetical protein [archaeon]